ncbi:hypothetical protein QUF94_24900 [Peribacillus sp. NJ4]|uniref:hypothetical protein n=1 Tax=Peribacillus sp. NJ4 TaxID=3055862 RepID=UPI0025A1671A|nr:hypothetical protein [Peribacillus sp. NJ4]MDM5214630.1 hypothetical protein [Peribacillus sp. NJ4]
MKKQINELKKELRIVSRFMNRKKDAPRNFKDEFAEYVLTELEFNFQKYKADYIDKNFDFVIEKDRAYIHVFD